MRKSIVDARRWMFDLTRFDEPTDSPAYPPKPTPPTFAPADPPVDPVDPPADPPADPSEPDTGKDKDAEIAKWKALARKQEDRAKANADKAKKFDDIEEANKTEAERLTAKAEAAEAKAEAATQRAVKAEIKSLATDFADPTDAEAAVDPKQFVDANGDIDTDGIKARLAELLEAKPHWKKATEPAKPKAPKPDPGQGSRATPPATNFKDADKATFEAELAKYGVRPKSS